MRNDLDEGLARLLATLLAMGDRADAMLGSAVGALAAGDADTARAVVADDAAVDAAYEEVQHGVLTLVALHAPVGHDLRMATAMMHASLHVERMADYATSVARTVGRTHTMVADHPEVRSLLEQLADMAALAQEVGRTALEAFARTDEDLARDVARRDDDVDRLNLGVFERLVVLAGTDPTRLPWASQMIGTARNLERYADHGVDVAEQVVFVATGRTVELGSGPELD